MNIRTLSVLAGSLAALFLATGCGKNDSAPAAAKPAASASASGGGIQLTGNDAMKYNLSAISLKAGEEAKITLRNIGTMPKAAMGHNLVILKPGTDTEAFALAAAAEPANDYIPAALESQIVAHTKMLGPKESATLTVTLEAGVYPFLCTFPAHFQVGMAGTITVE